MSISDCFRFRPASRGRGLDLRTLRFATVGAVLLLTSCVSAQPANADDPPLTAGQARKRVTRVEEDWRIVIGIPDERNSAPQIVTVMSPSDHLRDLHAIFELNHSTLPEPFAGGLQLQLWRRDYPIRYRSYPNSRVLAIPHETIEYTSRMTIDDGSLTFEIVDGSSRTWGQFGDRKKLRLKYRTARKDLRTYRPETSVRNSFVGFSSHRVQSMVLGEVRYYSKDKLIAQDSTPRIVHEHDPE